MFNRLLAAAVMLVGVQAGADASLINTPVIDIDGLQNRLMEQAETLGLEWTVGDTADYKIDMGFIKGTMKSRVRQETSEGFWMDQDMDLGVAGKQKVEILIDKNTGEILQLLVNGQKQDIPEPGNMEVEEMKEANISVPAGQFDCIYVRIKDVDKNQTSEAWINPQIIPMSGMIKQKSPSQFGEVTVELTGYNKQ